IPPLSWAYAPVEIAARLDPAGSRALLGAAGWAVSGGEGARRRGDETLSLRLLTTDSSVRWREVAEIGHQLRAVGIDVSVKTVAASDLRPRYLDTGDFQVALVGSWLAETDPDQFSLWHSTQGRGLGGNYSGISSPDLDRWLEL